MATKTNSPKRTPKGYRIEHWADGTYHVYRKKVEGYYESYDCIGEELTKQSALNLAYADKRKLKEK